MLSLQNTRLITVNTVIKAVTKILCVEVLRTVQKEEKKNDLGEELDAKERGYAHNI